jgi:hypothetical protein
MVIYLHLDLESHKLVQNHKLIQVEKLVKFQVNLAQNQLKLKKILLLKQLLDIGKAGRVP